MQGAQFESGRVPRTVELEFAADLVDACSPGDEVTVTGVLKVQSEEAGGEGGGGGGGGAQQQRKEPTASLHRLFLDAVAVACDKNVMKMRRSEFSAQDLEAIGRIRAEPCVLRLLVHSLCPEIYGHEMVKAGESDICHPIFYLYYVFLSDPILSHIFNHYLKHIFLKPIINNLFL